MNQEEKSKKVIEGCENIHFLKGYIIGLSMIIDSDDRRMKKIIEARSQTDER